VVRRLLRPRTAFPMSFALGLLVLWELGVLPVPFDADAGPIARAAIAVTMAVAGALVGFVAQWVFARVWGGDRS